MTTPLDRLEALARAAPRSDIWEAVGTAIQVCRGGTVFVSYLGNGTSEDAAFIVAASPATILELLATIRELRDNLVATGAYFERVGGWLREVGGDGQRAPTPTQEEQT